MMLAGNIPGQTRTVPQAIFTHLMAGETRAAWGLVVVSVADRDRRDDRRARLPGDLAKRRRRSARPCLSSTSSATVGTFHLEAQGRQDCSAHGPFRPFRRREDHAPPLHRGADLAAARHIRLGEEMLFDSARGVNMPPHRRRIGYVFQDGPPLPAHERPAEYRVRAAVRTGAPGLPNWRKCSTLRVSWTARRRLCPAAKGSAWRWPARWPRGRDCF